MKKIALILSVKLHKIVHMNHNNENTLVVRLNNKTKTFYNQMKAKNL